MRYAVILFIAVCCYYTLTYGMSLWRDDKNRIGGFGAVMIAMLGSVIPIAYMIWKM